MRHTSELYEANIRSLRSTLIRALQKEYNYSKDAITGGYIHGVLQTKDAG